MNVTGNVIFAQQITAVDQGSYVKTDKDFTTSFKQIVNEKQSDVSIENSIVDPIDGKLDLETQLNNWLEELSEQDLDYVIGWLEAELEVSNVDESQLIDILANLNLAEIEITDQKLQTILSTLSNESEIENESDQTVYASEFSNWTHHFVSVDYNVRQQMIQVETNQQTIDSINQLMNQFDDFTQKDAKQLLDLLNRMQPTEEQFTMLLDNLTELDVDQAKLTTFSKVYQNYLKRTALSEQTNYRSDSVVTSKDIMKWVKAAVDQISNNQDTPTNTFGQLFSQQSTHSTIEQMQIHLGHQVDSVDQMGEQLLSQFEKAISQSRFIQNLSGGHQLVLKIAPKSLGTIMVELTEIDGEMLVKLTATSQMAKEALEANVKELRHMFSPHNIVIEKQELEPVYLEQSSPFESTPDQEDSHEQNDQTRERDQNEIGEDSIRFDELLKQERM